jgi:anaphase-promoting complex subunit 8
MQPLSMNKGDVQIDLNQVRIDIRQGIKECNDRGLIQTSKWLAELDFSLKDHKIPSGELAEVYDSGIVAEDREAYTLAKAYFDCQEYDRAAHFLENCNSPVCVFLLRYSQYMSSEKKRLDNATDSGNENTESTQVLLDLLSYFKVCTCIKLSLQP